MHYMTREIRPKLIVMFSGFVFYMEEERDQKYEEKFTNSVVLILKKSSKNISRNSKQLLVPHVFYQNKSVSPSPRKNILAFMKMASIVQ